MSDVTQAVAFLYYCYVTFAVCLCLLCTSFCVSDVVLRRQLNVHINYYYDGNNVNVVPLVSFDNTVKCLVEWPWCEVAAPVVVIAVSIREEVAGEDRVAARNGTTDGGLSSGTSGTLAQSREIVGERWKADLQQKSDTELPRCFHATKWPVRRSGNASLATFTKGSYVEPG